MPEGQTTSMVEAALAAAKEGKPVLVVCHTASFARGYVASLLAHLCPEAIRTAPSRFQVGEGSIVLRGMPNGDEMWEMVDSLERRGQAAFYDHYVWTVLAHRPT